MKAFLKDKDGNTIVPRTEISWIECLMCDGEGSVITDGKQVCCTNCSGTGSVIHDPQDELWDTVMTFVTMYDYPADYYKALTDLKKRFIIFRK